MAEFKPFDLAAARGAGIRNALGMQQFQQNALNPNAVDPTGPMRNYAERLRMIENGATPKEIAIFDNYVRAMKIGEVNQVQSRLNPDGTVSPYGTLKGETDALEAVEGAKVRGKLGAELDLAPDLRDRARLDAESLKNVDLDYDPQIASRVAEETKVGAHKGELEAGKVKAQTNMAQMFDNTNLLDKTVTKALSMAGGLATGWTGRLMEQTAGTPAHDLYLAIIPLKSNAVLNAIKELKAAGGTLGQVTEKELPLLQGKYASLEQSASKEEFIKNLKEYNAQQKRSYDRIAAAYAKNYGKPFNMNEFMATNKGVIPSGEQQAQDDPLGLFQ